MLFSLVVSALIVLGSPDVGEIRGALQSSFPDSYRWIIGGAVALAAAIALGSAFLSLRRRTRDAGRVPAQRKTNYELLKVFDADDGVTPLDLVRNADERFGSYRRLTGSKEFRYAKR